jgi:hypothetical protein
MPVYMRQHSRFEQLGPNGEKGYYTCKLNKALYGLKQSGRLWHQTLTTYMRSYGFEPTKMDPCVFVYHKGDKWIVVWAYVDDLGIFSNDEATKEQFIEDLTSKYKVTNEGPIQYYLGVNIQKSGNTVALDQRKHIGELLEEFSMDKEPHFHVTTPVADVPNTDATPLDEEQASTCRRMVGCLVYIATMTRPDVAYAVSCVSRHLHAPAVMDRKAVKRIYRYLRHTKDETLVYSSPDAGIELVSDSNFSNCKETARSTTALVLIMFGSPVYWKSIRQQVVALSTTEAEYMAMCAALQALLFISQFLEELGIPELMQRSPFLLQGDNEGAIKMVQEGSTNIHTKHIHRKFHFLREKESEGFIHAIHIKGNLNKADGLTKRLGKTLHRVSMKRLGLRNLKE